MHILLAEVEVAVRLGADLPERATPYAADDIAAAVASVHPALELIRTSFVDRSSAGEFSLLGDLQGNGAIVVGAAVTDWTALDYSTLPTALLLDRREVKQTATGAGRAQILEALAWLANHAAARGLSLKSGVIIITGSRVINDVGTARDVHGQIAGPGSVSLIRPWRGGGRACAGIGAPGAR